MNRHPWIFTTLGIVVLLLVAGSSRAAPVYRIMPLGDSITAGGGGTNAGYRGPLCTLLTNAHYSFQFVGSLNNAGGSLPTSPIDQTHHEGHSGYVITAGTSGRPGITDEINTWLGPGGTDPNIILLMIGSNDRGYQFSTAPDRLSNLISMISDKTTGLKPNAKLIVAKITPVIGNGEGYGGPADVAVVTYNTGVASVVAAHQALGENVSLVDMHSALNPAYDLWDGLHPNDSGYNKMATVWMNGIKAVAVPEPSSLLLLGLGALGFAAYRRVRCRRP